MAIKLTRMPLKDLSPDSIAGASLYGMRRHPTLKVMKMHDGIDKAASTGTAVYATADGKVLVSKMQSDGKGYGNYIVIRHNGFDTLYAHLSKRVAVAGRTVKAGDLIGNVGSTGESSGPHLHFGICADFNAAQKGWVDPLPYLKNILKSEDDEVVKDTKMLINGKEKTVKAINKDGNNFVKLRDLEDVLIVDYDAKKNLPIVTARK